MSLLSRLAVSAARAYGVLSSNKNNVSASYLVVAGGGAGGTVGGGGAGGYQASTATLSTLNIYSITVGAGAVGIQGAGGAVGSNSVLSGTGLTTITSIGGGGGSAESVAGSTGGSGGGGGGSVAVRSGLAGTSGQGFAGGDGADNGIGTIFVGGGGGGASAVGSNASSSSVAGSGGNGTASSISGSSVTYAGGGGGGGYVTGGTATAGTGGTGGGGNGGRNGLTATSGTTNTGSGGGGGGYTSAGSYQGAAGSGGSGVVIISYTSATPKFVGGTLTTSGGNQIHTFTSSGTLSPLTPITASYLVVAGGGSGGTDGSGGGGAGGLLTSSTTLYSGATYIVTVGAGGAGLGVSSATGNNGSNSSLSGTGLTTITSTGGGGGGYYSAAGNAGGSGGGGGGLGPYGGGAGTSGQGNNGGTGLNSTNYYGGGGGGAGAVGASATSAGGGAGGIGSTSSISGTSTYYAGGGGGAGDSRSNAGGAGGLGGGGASNASSAGVSGTANTGGGGGAGGYITRTSGAGGSGTVIISYAGSQVFNGGLVTSSGGNTIHTFNATGALTPLTNNLNNSLRFRSSASAYLSRTPASNGNRQIFTFSFWAKRGTLSAAQEMYFVNSGGGNFSQISWAAGNGFTVASVDASVAICELITTPVYRDPSAWYHIVVSVDTTQATSANRIKIYVNGNQVTALSTATYPTLNYNFQLNNTTAQNIGRPSTGTFDGYMAEFNFIDGQALEPYYFGNNDAYGNWKPILYKGTYGTNGFYLTFADTSALTTSSNAGLGKDTSGNGNYWATNNISITAGTTYDAMLDVPTNTSATVGNYCVMNPLGNAVGSAPATLSDANLTCKNTATSYLGALGTMGLPTSGKFYWEVQLTQNSGASNLSVFGIAPSTVPLTGNQANYANSIAWYMGNTTIIQLPVSGAISISGSGSITTDVFQICYDGSTGKVYFGKNNTFYNSAGASTGNPSSGTNETATLTTGDLLPWFYAYQEGAYFNFGQRPFTYTAPTGYVALNTYNLPTPTILQGNLYMDATLYTGTGTSLVTVNAGQFKPDFVWTKCRSFGYDHGLFDSVRGVTKLLSSNSTAAETTQANTLTSFNSNGFTVVANGATGVSGDTYVGWQWQAGQGSSSSNTDGTITSTVSVNATAGFSIVTYTGIGSSPKTVGHGLGVAPKMIFLKNRGSAVNWYVWHTSLGATQAIEGLNTTSAATTQATFNSTLPTSSVISLGNNDSNNSGSTYVLYVWAEIAGFSKFGSYTGNGSTDGPFVFTGFRPKFVIFKLSSAAGGDWKIIDASRSAYNVAGNELSANTSAAESTGATDMDMLSNGFKIRATYGDTNSSGATYIYAAYAENPFKNANAR